MAEVPRHLFVPEDGRADAYADHALPIGAGQTISQPYIVGLMTSLLEVGKGSRVLEIGTGSGYQAAVLGEVAGEVYTIEILPPLAERAQQAPRRVGLPRTCTSRTGDGYRGWPDRQPFDAILVTAAPPTVPLCSWSSSRSGDTWSSAGQGVQDLLVLTKRPDGTFDRRSVAARALRPDDGRRCTTRDDRPKP